MSMVFAGAMCGLAGRDLMQPKCLPTHCGGQKYQPESSLCFTLHEVCLKSLPCTQAAILNQGRWTPSQLSVARLPKSILARLPLVPHSHRSLWHPLILCS
jgi:hypothetical protein